MRRSMESSALFVRWSRSFRIGNDRQTVYNTWYSHQNERENDKKEGGHLNNFSGTDAPISP